MAYKVLGGAAVLIIVVLMIASIHIVPAGERGVVTYMGAVKGLDCNEDQTVCKVVEPPLREGFNWKLPFFESVINMDVKTIKFPHEQIDSETGESIPKVISVSSPTSDQQEMRAEVLVIYHVNGENVNLLYKAIGLDFETKVLSPLIKTSIKTAMVDFTAEEIMKQRGTVQSAMSELLSEKLYGLEQCKGCIILESVELTNVDPPDAYQAIVNAKAEKRETAAMALIALEINRMTAEAVVIDANGIADALRAQSQGVADARIIEALGEARYIKEIEAACGCEFTEYLKIVQWDGAVSKVTGSNGNLISIPLP